MKLIRVLVIVIILMIFLNMCNNHDNGNFNKIKVTKIPVSFKLVKRKSILLGSNDLIIAPRLIKVKDSNFFYVSSINKNNDNELRKYDIKLNLVEKIILKSGRGPNEYYLPIIIGGDKRNFIIYEGPEGLYSLTNSRFLTIKEYRKDFSGINSLFSLNYGPKAMQFQQAFSVFEQSNRRMNNFCIFNMHVKENELLSNKIFCKKYEILTEDGEVVTCLPFHYSIIENNMYYLELDKYTISKIDLKGNFNKGIRVTNISNISITTGESNKLKKVLFKNRNLSLVKFPDKVHPTCWIVKLYKGFAVGRRESYSPDSSEKWIDADYFNLDLNYIGKTKLPWFADWNHPEQSGNSVSFKFLTFSQKKILLISPKYLKKESDYFFSLSIYEIEE